MRTIYKYKIETTDRQEIRMPQYSRILTVQTQYEAPCLWAEVDDTMEMVERHIETFGTGHSIPVGLGVVRIYIGSYQLRGGALIFHVYERIN
jgi:hypothetical protein